jgi:hypothetical protein
MSSGASEPKSRALLSTSPIALIVHAPPAAPRAMRQRKTAVESPATAGVILERSAQCASRRSRSFRCAHEAIS